MRLMPYDDAYRGRTHQRAILCKHGKATIRFLHVQKWRCIWWAGSPAEQELSAQSLFMQQCKYASAIIRSVLAGVYHPHHEERGSGVGRWNAAKE